MSSSPAPPPLLAQPVPSSPIPDSITNACEYIPPAPPPSLVSSESMRRLRDMISAGKLVAGDQLAFSYAGSAFAASLASTGALIAPAPRPSVSSSSAAECPPVRLSDNVRRLYASPSDFASDMARVAIYADPKGVKPRGGFSVNGWEACSVDGRSLAHIRNEMLRQKKPTAPAPSPSPSSVPPSPVDSALVEDAKSGLGEYPQLKDEKTGVVGGEAPDGLTGPVKADTVEAEKSLEPTPVEKDVAVKEGALGEKALRTDTLASSMPAEVKTEAGLNTADPKAHNYGNVTDIEISSARIEKAVEEKFDEDTPEIADKVTDEGGDGVEAGGGNDDAISTEKDPAVEQASDSDGLAPNFRTSSAEQRAATEGVPTSLSREQQELEKSSSPEVIGVVQKDEEESLEDSKSPSPKASDGHEDRTMKVVSLARESVKKRKRGEMNDSTPSGATTPSRRSQERSIRPRTDGTRLGKKLELPPAPDVDTEGLDPEAIEAAAVAAQAEKDEAHNRARRTTRLAAGKIKQVDYKSSNIVQGTRGSSPGHDEEEGDPFQSTDSVAEPARNSRRRVAAQIPPAVPPRSSRRVARMRGSQERDPSSNEDADHSRGRNSSAGNGSNDRMESDSNHHAMDNDSGTGTRMNGTRNEGRERKRTRSDNASRRTRQNQADISDGEAGDRQYLGTRASTRENSVGDVGDVGSAGDLSEKEDAEDDDMDTDDDIEARVGTHGWTMTELSQIVQAVDTSSSIAEDTVNSALSSESTWVANESAKQRVASYLKNAVSQIAELKKELLSSEDDNVDVDELKAFIATDVWRLKTGGIIGEYPRTTKADVRRTEIEEQRKILLDRARRKLQRENEEARNKLDTDMEGRRSAELEAGYVEIQLCETSHILPRERKRRQQLDMEVERYQMMRAYSQSQLDKTKMLVGFLRGERESPDDFPMLPRNPAPSMPSGAKTEVCENGDIPKGKRVAVGESVTSDDDVVMSNKEEESVSERQQEMERLRMLIAARETEAESAHRACEALRLSFASTLDAKNRLEAELYLQRSSHGPGGDGGTSHLQTSHSQKPAKDSRKGDSRHSGSGTPRQPGSSRPKPSGSKTTNGQVQGTPVPKPPVSHKAKSSTGKGGEQSKKAKRNGSSKVQTGSGEKQ